MKICRLLQEPAYFFAVAREIIALLVLFHTIAVTRKSIFSILCE